ncbi:hypothetical protein FNO01nite_07750 [Flavobacterium noncentrifugens]|uniref:DUF1569 domain-containing protein n=1 Tax=Flavobacterium noncentrifugens TaxID=1128970 RepID=A0A1G8T620_9FLAO|nr:DUF1569 domain-containing protein [Flavobacterium noncentrifugens]GEP50103.1 hypothetical protein FNO01nite_07750 [Flavobacterium noncentrifugens]SDJ36966.1 Protein of unknown function [Flavobacterium noncentrifugens]
MTNIFDKQDNESLLKRLQQLHPESQPLWGKMTVSQMVLHCQKPIDVALGKLILKGGLLGFLFGKIAKNSFIKNLGFSKNSPTLTQFKISGNPDFEKERQILMAMIANFETVGPKIIVNKVHPFFGEMSDEEWGTLHYVHLDHHLKQFVV